MSKKNKRSKENITLGSGYVHYMEFEGEMPDKETICTDNTLMGYTKGGATLTYDATVYEEKDDLGHVHKTLVTDESAKFKPGLITWNGNTLNTLIDRCKVEEKDGLRIAKIGGHGNSKGKKYVLCFHHVDKQDGDIWVMLVGQNTAGLSLAFATTAGTQIEPEFTALPHDDDGTLIEFIEEIDKEE